MKHFILQIAAILCVVGLAGCANFGATAHRVSDSARATVKGVCAIPPDVVFDGVDWVIDITEDVVGTSADAAVQ